MCDEVAKYFTTGMLLFKYHGNAIDNLVIATYMHAVNESHTYTHTHTHTCTHTLTHTHTHTHTH